MRIPLKSLYRGCFPAYFHDQFFLRGNNRVGAWCNGWRQTDPVATQMPISGAQEVEIPNEDPADVRGHSYYWNEEALTVWVQGRLAPGEGSAS
ncbi:hypothetical protein [Streptomyces canus]|uniref:hypothetical protein n=1 Tax=Streptomyces canus TaxID=58343 RepID=UPI002E358941|nr:hypothetical protein [Streptomyces canus]